MSGDQSVQAICLVSGGLDSLVCAAIAHQSHQENLAFLHINYGQKTEKKELACFHQIADHYNIPSRLRLVADIGFLKLIGGSSLTDDSIEVKSFDPESSDIPDSYVPFRNTHILATAVSWAEVLKASSLYIGAVEEDSSGYPDCREEYYQAFNELLKVAVVKQELKVHTPLIHLSKREIVLKAKELSAPIEKSWSCYGSEDLACGQCDSCVLRLRGFHQAKIKDPLNYASIPDFLK